MVGEGEGAGIGGQESGVSCRSGPARTIQSLRFKVSGQARTYLVVVGGLFITVGQSSNARVGMQLKPFFEQLEKDRAAVV